MPLPPSVPPCPPSTLLATLPFTASVPALTVGGAGVGVGAGEVQHAAALHGERRPLPVIAGAEA